MTKSSVSEYGTPWWSGIVFGMPDGRLAVEQPDAEPGQPVVGGRAVQLDLRPRSIVLVPRIAGVHSTVWIFAIRAETIRRAVW